MYVLPISNTQPQFKAKIASTKEYESLVGYLNKYASHPEGVHNTTNELNLLKKVENAFEAFPSDAELKFSVIFRPGELYNARGVVESQYAKYADTEPARNTSEVPIPNIMKRMLNPENKDWFKRLMGNDSEETWNVWWNFYVAPIWAKVKHYFYETTIYQRDIEPDFDLMFRRANKN